MKQIAAIILAVCTLPPQMTAAQRTSAAQRMREAYGLAGRDWPQAVRSAEDAVRLAVQELNRRVDTLLASPPNVIGRQTVAETSFDFESALLTYVNDNYDPIVHRALSLAQHVKQRPDAGRQLQRARLDIDQISATWALNAKGVGRELIGRRLADGGSIAYRRISVDELDVPAKSIAIEIVKFEMYELDGDRKSGGRYGLWFIDPDRRVRTHIVDAQGSLDLEQQARSAHTFIGSLTAGYDVPMRRVRELLFGTAVPQAEWWIISPAADLWLVPFGALPIENRSATRSGRTGSTREVFAVTKYVISYAMSCRFLTRESITRSEQPANSSTARMGIRALLFANPDFDMPLSEQGLTLSEGGNASRRVAVGEISRTANIRSDAVGPAGGMNGAWTRTEPMGHDGRTRRGWLDGGTVTTMERQFSGTLHAARAPVHSAVHGGLSSIQPAAGIRLMDWRGAGCSRPRPWLILPHPSCCAPLQPPPQRGDAQLLTFEFAPPRGADALPTLGANFTPLPQTQPLALAIVEELEEGNRKPVTARVLTGDGARELEFHNAAEVDVLVFCTHGFFFNPKPAQEDAPEYERMLASNPDPFMRCGLQLAGSKTRVEQRKAEIEPEKLDGILTGREIVAQKPVVAKDFVALLACRGGEGTELRSSDDQIAGDSLASLRESFLTSGSIAVLASNWNLPLTKRERDPTRVIVLDFFDRMSRAGAISSDSSIEGIAPYVRALHEAQRAYLSSPDSVGRRHPYHWAALSITGRWAQPDAAIGGTGIDQTGEAP